MSEHNSDYKTDQTRTKKARLLYRIDRARSKLIVSFYTLPLYAVALFILLGNGHSINMLMFVYMAVYAVFAVNMVVKLCPECGGQFFVKSFFLNPLTRKCVHCGVSSHPAGRT